MHKVYYENPTEQYCKPEESKWGIVLLFSQMGTRNKYCNLPRSPQENSKSRKTTLRPKSIAWNPALRSNTE